MKNSLLALVFAIIPLLSNAQQSFESTLAFGGTIVDIEALVLIDEVPGTDATRWGQFSAGLSLQYFYELN